MNKLELFGHIANEKPMIHGLERFNEIFRQNNKKRFIMEITIVDPGQVKDLVWYIIKVVVPALIEGHQKKGRLITPKDALEEIQKSCPIFNKTEKTYYKIFDWGKYMPDCTLSKESLSIAIDWIHLYCLDNFNIALGSNKTI